MIYEIKIKWTDIIQCEETWNWESDENGWKGYHIWCVDGGAAQIIVNGESYHVIPGDIFLFDLKYNHSCTHNPENPLRVTTVYFECRCGEPVRKVVRQNHVLCEMLRKAVDYHRKGQKELALMWFQPALHEIMEMEEQNPIAVSVLRACKLIEEHFPAPLSLQKLSEGSGYSKNQLIRLFRQNLGVTPGQYETRKRVERAKSMLVYSSSSISEIAYQVGYMDVSYFTKVFKKEVGYSPSAFRKLVKWNL